MALFNKNILGEIRRSIGNITFINSRFGNYIRQKVRPFSRQTVSKKKSKDKYAYVRQLWAQLTPAQHQQWLKFAETFIRVDNDGNEFQKRAYDIFRTVNRNLIEINEPITMTPPPKVYPELIDSLIVKITASSTLEDIQVFINTSIPQNTKYIIFASPNMSLGRNSTKKHFYKEIAVIDSSFISGTSFLKEYISAGLNFMPPTFKIAFRYRAVSTISGLSSTPREFIVRPS